MEITSGDHANPGKPSLHFSSACSVTHSNLQFTPAHVYHVVSTLMPVQIHTHHDRCSYEAIIVMDLMSTEALCIHQVSLTLPHPKTMPIHTSHPQCNHFHSPTLSTPATAFTMSHSPLSLAVFLSLFCAHARSPNHAPNTFFLAPYTYPVPTLWHR